MTHLVIFQQFYNKLFKMANREQSPNVIAAKKRSQSQKRFIKLEKKGFEIQATKLRSDYNNRYMLNQIKLKSHSNKKLLTQIQPQKIGNFLKPTKIITATAHKWAIYDFFSSKYIRGYRAKDFCQLGAFSKLLVFCAVNTIVQKNSLDTDRFQTIVTESVLKLHKGNSILKKDDIVSLKDLLYLMVIEESEVYESILAVNMGAFLQRKRQKQYYSVFDTKDKYMKEHLKIFYELVNSYCKLLKLENIRYIQADPELRKEKNKGSASDICVLTLQCLKIPLYMTILKVLTYNVTVKYINSEGNLVHRIQIITNKSVLNKFIPYCNVCRNWDENNFMDSNCSIFYQNQALQLRPIVVVLLGCYGPIDREKDIQQIVQWYLKNSKSQSKQAQPQNESQKPEKKREISAQKLPFIKVSSSNIVSQDPLSKKLRQKLKIDKNSAITNRYDDAIKFKVNPISKRVKTQLQ